MPDPRADVYRPYQGRLVKIWLTLRPENTVSGRMRIIETPEGSPQPFAGFVIETDKGPQTISFGESRKFELLDKAPKTEPRKYVKLSDKTGVNK